jgi:topoisomerase-4 subunit A
MASSLLPAGEMRPIALADALSERYLSYALSTITARSLPDVRDGLKPVHRRLLYAMRELRLDPESGFKKCARIVGDVMGKFHPHGDQAIYDALVRLAQDFAERYPLVDGQGNFGNIDGDGPAAMRYTEARLTAIADTLLQGLDENAVDFRPTYDGESQEPVVLPAGFPNLLANGAAGIAVGMATNIPPHNVDEICAALLHLIKHPKSTIAKLLEFMPGPDFPTGGVLVEDRATVTAAYTSGRGQLRVRARWEKEELPRAAWQIVITEIPYQTPKARLIERIAQLLQDKKLPLLGDVHDESAEDVRLVLEPKSRNVDPVLLMESLYRHTELESRFGLNMNVLDGRGVPRVMSLREVLQEYLDHRHEVLVRRSQHRLTAIEDRLHVLAGLLIAYLNVDQVIKIIRRADEPKRELMQRFKLSETQTEAILNMRLRALNKLSEIEIKRENETLSAERKELQRLLKDQGKRWDAIAAEIQDIRKRFGAKAPGGKRRTRVADAPIAIEVPEEALVEKEPVTVVCSQKGWLRAFKGHMQDTSEIRYKEGDGEQFILRCESTDKLLVFATNGRFYTIACDKLPGGRGDGEPVKLMVEMEAADPVQIMVQRGGRKFVVAGKDGRGFVVPEDDVIAQTRTGKQVLNVPEGGAASVCAPVEGDMVAVIGENRKLLLFKLAELPEMSRGRGVILQRYKDGALSDLKTFKLADGLSWRSGQGVRVETELRDWIGERGQAGRLPPKGFPRDNRFGSV